MLQYIGFQNVCVCLCHGHFVVNALVIVNVRAFHSGFLFLSRFYCKCTMFIVALSFLRINVWSFLCAYQSRFTRFGCWFMLCSL